MKKISLVGLCIMSLAMLSACTSKNVAVVQQPTTPSITPAISSEVVTPTLEQEPQAFAQKKTMQKAVAKTITPVKTSTPAITPVATPKPATVSIQNFAFSAPTVRIKKGAGVTWTNLDSAPHTITSDAGSFTSANLAQGKSYSFIFNTAGSFAYHCKIHPSMKGTIIVE